MKRNNAFESVLEHRVGESANEYKDRVYASYTNGRLLFNSYIDFAGRLLNWIGEKSLFAKAVIKIYQFLTVAIIGIFAILIIAVASPVILSVLFAKVYFVLIRVGCINIWFRRKNRAPVKKFENHRVVYIVKREIAFGSTFEIKQCGVLGYDGNGWYKVLLSDAGGQEPIWLMHHERIFETESEARLHLEKIENEK